jgi:hypothetical protein
MDQHTIIAVGITLAIHVGLWAVVRWMSKPGELAQVVLVRTFTMSYVLLGVLVGCGTIAAAAWRAIQ